MYFDAEAHDSFVSQLKTVDLTVNKTVTDESFMHQKGIIRDNELRKIERVIEELNVPLRKFYERNTWKYRFLEAWR